MVVFVYSIITESPIQPMRLSILIPTCERPDKLRRNLLHVLSCVSKLPVVSKLFNDFEILIGDGSRICLFDLWDNKYKLCYDTLNRLIGISYYHLPSKSMPERIAYLSSAAIGKFVLMGSDDDLTIFESVGLFLDKLESDDSITSITGAFLNIRSWDKHAFIFDPVERPYTGFTIDSVIPLQRWLQYCTVNSLGTSSLYYCITSRDTFACLAEILGKHPNLYHGGIEAIFQLFLTIVGNVNVSNLPFLLRDFTYINYKHDPMREAPEFDEFPYHGVEAINVMTNLLCKYSSDLPITPTLAKLLIENVIAFGQSLQEPRRIASECINKQLLNKHNIESLLLSNGNTSCISIAHNNWCKTSDLCYTN